MLFATLAIERFNEIVEPLERRDTGLDVPRSYVLMNSRNIVALRKVVIDAQRIPNQLCLEAIGLRWI